MSTPCIHGGLPAWVRAGYALESGDVVHAPGDLVVRPGHLPVLDADDAAAQVKDLLGGSNAKPFPSAMLLLASHNKESLVAAHELHQQRTKAQLPTVPVKFAQLHGMSDEVSFSLLKLKDDAGVAPEVYKCSTWGTLAECMAYLTRRGMENRDAASRTHDEYSALKTEAWRRLAFWR